MDSKTPFSILLVEDDNNAREIILSILELKYPEAQIYNAADGKAGLDAFGLYLPDIVITDINMPEMDGIRMLEIINTIKPDARVVVVTAHSDKKYLEKISSTGFDVELVGKPIDFTDLLAAIDRLMAV